MSLKVIAGEAKSQDLNDNFSYLDTKQVEAEQLEDNSVRSIKLRITTDEDRIKLANLSEEVLQAMAGTTPINMIPADNSVTPIKIAPEAVEISKLAIETKDFINSSALNVDTFYNLLEMKHAAGTLQELTSINTGQFDLLSFERYRTTLNYLDLPEDAPFDETARMTNIFQYNYDLQGGNLSYIGKTVYNAEDQFVSLGGWFRKSDILKLTSGVKSIDFLYIIKDSGGSDINSMSAGFTPEEATTVGSYKTNEDLAVRVNAEIGDWVHIEAIMTALTPLQSRIVAYFRVVNEVSPDKIDICNYTFIREDQIVPWLLYPNTQSEFVLPAGAATTGIRDIDLLKDKHKTSVINLYDDVRTGDRIFTGDTVNAVKTYLDNTEEDTPYSQEQWEKMLRVTYLGTPGNTAGYIYFPAQVDVVQGDICIMAGWLRISDLDRMPPEVRFSITAIVGKAGGGSESVTMPELTIETTKVEGYKAVTVHGTNGQKMTYETKKIYKDWIFFNAKIEDFVALAQDMNFYLRFRYLPTTAPEDHYDILGYTITKNEDEIYPFIYPGEAAPEPVEPGPNVINIKNAEKIVIVGDSFSASHYAIKEKAYIQNLAMLSDYNFENYSRSGYDYIELNNSIRNNAPLYHTTLGFKDYNAKYAVLISNENDGYYTGKDPKYYYDNLNGLIQTVKALGVEPIISTEFGSNPDSGYGEERALKGLCEMAQKNNARFIDIVTITRLLNEIRFLPFWGSGHPATRTGFLFADEMHKKLLTLPRPRQAIKIFRKRDSFVHGGLIENLLFDNILQRAEKFKELIVGQHSLTETTKFYYDQLDVENGNEKITSEYLKLQNKETISFGEYGLIDIIIPTTAQHLEEFNLHLSDNLISVYGRHMFTPPYPSDVKYQAFNVSGSPVSNVGNTYTSDDPQASGTTFTVVEVRAGQILCSPYKSVNIAGTLTLVTGTGDPTIAYDSAQSDFLQSYYDQLFKPKGKYVLIPNDGEKYPIAKTDFKDFMNYDKISLLLYKAGGFDLSDVYVTWDGKEVKSVEYLKEKFVASQNTELLAETLVGSPGELASWTIEGTIIAETPDDNNLPKGTTGISKVSDTNKLSQTYAIVQSEDAVKTLQIKVWARRYPVKFDHTDLWTNAPINEDTFDLAKLGLSVIETGKAERTRVEYSDYVGLHWKQVVFNVKVPTFTNSQTITILSLDKEIEIAKASIKEI